MEPHKKRVKIFAIPFAGGSKYSYRVLQTFVPSQFHWETLELPGRGGRIQEALLPDIRKTAEDIFQKIRSRINEEEYLIYGHSMGTLLGYELTKKIIEAGLNKPVCLFLTGCSAPAVKKNRKISAYEKGAFWKEIQEMGGLPEEIMAIEEMKDFFEPVLRSDFKAVENYEYQALDKPLPIPLFIRTGNDEKILREDVMRWQDETRYDLNFKTMPGDHFCIFQNPEYLIGQIVEAYARSKVINEGNRWRRPQPLNPL